jgi:putative peptidoglycan lipid II flippase
VSGGGGGDRADLARSSVAVAVGTLLSRLTGLLRVGVLAWAIGGRSLADTYNFANTAPNIVYELLLGGILAATVVPIFVGNIERDDDRATNAIFTLAIAALGLFTVIAMAGSPLIARLFALRTAGDPARAALNDAQVHVFTLFILCFLPQILGYGLTALAGALLNARRRFVAAAFAPVCNNLVVIGVLVAFAARTSGERHIWTDVTRVRDETSTLLFLGIGTTLGIVAMAAVLLPALRRAHVRLRPVYALRDPAVRTLVRLSGWTIGYVVANQVSQLFVLVLANRSSGNVSAYFYAFTFAQVPQGLLAVTIMTTLMPELARRAAAGDLPGLRRDFSMGLRYLLVCMVPASAAFAVLAQAMIGVLRVGSFASHNARVTGDTLQLFALSLVPLSVYLYTLRGFYALQDTRTPFRLNAFENVCNVVLAVALFPSLGVQGLALAWTIAYGLGAVAALAAFARRLGGLRAAEIRRTATRALTGAAALAIIAGVLAGAIGRGTAARAALATIVAGAAGAAVYIAVLLSLRANELGAIVGLVRRRGKGGANVSP